MATEPSAATAWTTSRLAVMAAGGPALPDHHSAVQAHCTVRTLILRAVRKSDDLPVVLKTIAPGCSDALAARRLRTEFELLDGLCVPGVVRAHRLLHTVHGPLLELDDLGEATLLDSHRPLPVPTVLQIGMALATALAACHRHGVLHLDLSPTNIAYDAATGQVTLLDFGAGRRLQGKTTRPAADGGLGGTLGYWAPEQTGRLAAPLDRRTDLFNVGAVLYWLLTGVAPGPTDDLLRATHAVLALLPPPPILVRAAVPEVVSRIVMKLLAKVADDRYRSAQGLLNDLRRASEGIDAAGGIAPFELGQADVSEVFSPSRRLYGRDAALDLLQSRLIDATTTGIHAAITVVGPSGAGKSALVAEAARRFSASGAIVATGKADHAGSRPLAVLLQALTAALRARLSLPEAPLARIRARACAAAASAGPALFAVVPGLQALTGALAPVAELPPAESLNRTAAALESLVFALHDPADPLVLFLDDLQWADPPSLQIVERLLLRPAHRPMLVLSWRDAEVGPTHPLITMLLRLPAATFEQLRVEPLTPADVAAFVYDSLHCTEQRAADLAATLTAKCAGNPYFIAQLFETLHERGLLRMDEVAQQWTWDAAAVAAVGISDNVATLLTERLSSFAPLTCRLLSLAARLGHTVPLPTLAIAAGISGRELAEQLAPAVTAEHLFELGSGLAGAAEGSADAAVVFAHDRVQAAAEELTPPATRAAEALTVARRLLTAGDAVDVFVAADACLAALAQPAEPADALPFAVLLAQASQAARLGGAPLRALGYAEAAATLLGDRWSTDHDLMAGVYLAGALASVVALDRSPQPDFIAVLLAQERDPLQRAAVHALKLDRHLAKWENEEALDATLLGLRELGIVLPRQPGQAAALQAVVATAWRLWRLGNAALDALPVATDPRVTAAQDLLLRAATAAYYSCPTLLPLLIMRCIDLTLSGGLGPCSPWAFASYAFIQAVLLGNLDRAVYFASLARAQDQRVAGRFFQARLELNIVGFVQSRTGRLDAVPEAYAKLAQDALAQGDWEYAVICANNYLLFGLSCGRNLLDLAQHGDEVIAQCSRVGHRRWTLTAKFYAQIVDCLRGGPADPGGLSGGYLAIAEMEAGSIAIGDQSGVATCACTRTFVRVHLGEFERALQSADAGEPLLAALVGAPQAYWHHVAASVARAWCARSAHGSQRRTLLRAAARGRRALSKWAKASPHNHGHQCTLVDGAILAGQDRLDAAAHTLELAAQQALAEGFVHDAALAMHVAALVAVARGLGRAAAAYFAAAAEFYHRWGASACAERMELAHRRTSTVAGSSALSQSASVDSVATDHVALLRAAQAIAQQNTVDGLLRQLLQGLMEAVGARRGLLAMPSQGTMRAVAAADATGTEIVVRIFGLAQSMAIDSALPASTATLAFVARSGERVLIEDARRGGRVSGSAGGDARSVMAAPIRKGDEILGVVYLDNDMLPGAFTAAHDEFVSVLAAQAAVALENALLVDNLRGAVQTQRQLALSYGRFVPHQFLDQIRRRSILEVQAGDQVVREFTVLFADVRGFTAIAERLQAENTFAFINEYLRYVQPAIDQHGGFINQFLGDGIVALFATTPDAAIAGSLAVLRGVHKYNQERNPRFPEIAVGAGLNTGSLVLGVLGSEDRMDCAVIGDAVNLSARVEGMTKTYGAPLLISGSTAMGLTAAGAWSLREIDLVVPVGRVQPIAIVEVLDAQTAALRQGKMHTATEFAAARQAYSSGHFAQARLGLQRCLAACPGDRAAQVLVERCDRFEREGPPPGWDGAYRLTVK